MIWSLQYLLFFIICCRGFLAMPAMPQIDEREPDVNEGSEDIVMSSMQRFLANKLPTWMARNGLLASYYQWPNRTVLYQLDQRFSTDEINAIHSAFAHIETNSCVHFQPAMSHHKNGMVLIHSDPIRCSSNVGFQHGIQYVHLASGCFRIGTIVHELMHTLGFFHQHSAWNRDQYIRVLYENIQAGRERNFDKYTSNYVSDFGVDYDYGSVMHYSAYAFSKNGHKTIEPYANNVEIGQRLGLSVGDIQKLNRMYNC